MNAKTGNGDESNQKQMQQYFLKAEAILKYFLGTSEKISTMIMCKGSTYDLATTDYELYQALGSVTSYDNVAKAKLTKLLEAVDVLSHRRETGEGKKVLTHERAEELRKIAINDKGDDKNG